MDYFLQFLVLAFTGIVWWLARRDLNTRAAQNAGGQAAEWRNLQATVEDLLTALEQRAEAIEKRLAEAERRAAALAAVNPGALDGSPAEDERYAPVYALAASGVTDTTEIARRTGLGRGEVQLLLDLHSRRAVTVRNSKEISD